jgi:hypothetical protein
MKFWAKYNIWKYVGRKSRPKLIRETWLQTCHDLIVRHGQALQRSLTDLESLNAAAAKETAKASTDTSALIKAVNERATIFKITSNALINASTEFLDLCHVRRFFFFLDRRRSCVAIPRIG